MGIEVAVLILSFALLLVIGAPIAFSLCISAALTLLVSMPGDIAMATLAQRMATGLDSFALLAIPFFILAGELMNRGGIATRLIDFAKALVGSLPGGLAHVNIVACMLFGAISGSAVAAVSAIGSFMTDRMEKEGYDRAYSAAVNITSGTTGLIIPPSNVIIVYSLASGGASIGALFLAGYLPGILVGLLLMVTAGIYALKRKYPVGDRMKLSLAFKYLVRAVPSLFLLILIIGGIISGIFTPTEAAAVAVVYALVLSMMVYKEIAVKDLLPILISTCKTSGIVLFLVACSIGMSWVMAYEDLPQSLSTWMLSFSDNPVVILLLINLILLFVGIFMDITPAVLIFTPIFLPIVQELGISEVHFGIMMVFNLCIGLCTPPVGSVLFVGCSIANLKITQVIKPLIPLFIAMIIALLLITFIPGLSLWLPELFGL
ncbi:MAG: TRAP transporter large permease [Bacteroidetes bacterium]|nr:MAG: TRAP transporter large permease [Bacteroidota bacterium]